MKARIYGAAPEKVRVLYHRFRKHILKSDVHVRIGRVAVSHVQRYVFAAQYVEKMDVLDVACGSGYGAVVLGTAANYMGIDLDPHAIAEARREFPEFDYHVGSIFDLPLASESVDVVTSFETLEHIEVPEHAVAECARVLRPGGVMIGSIPIDHPDRVFHVRPYSATEAYEVLCSSPLLSPIVVARQHLNRIQRVGLDASVVATSCGGALVVVLQKGARTSVLLTDAHQPLNP